MQLTIMSAVGGDGWCPILRLISIAERVFDADVVEAKKSSGFAQLKQRWLPTKRGATDQALLLVTPTPGSLAQLAASIDRSAYGFVAALITDSFWSEHISPYPYTKVFDHLFLLTGHDTDQWHQKTGVDVTVTPWGSDTTIHHPTAEDRPIDVLRVGRQPSAWEDDTHTKMVLGARDIHFRGRPGPVPYTELCRFYGSTKIAVASTNLLEPPNYVHKTKEYVTGRWVDAIAMGGMVAGKQPMGDPMITTLTEPSDLLELTGTDLDEDADRLKNALESWDPALCAARLRRARMTLDWRWRLKTIAQTMGLPTDKLDLELASLSD